jgi:hypothetical protein
MSKRVNSNKPFGGQCNINSTAGPVYSKFCPPVNVADNTVKNNRKNPCFGPYDNLTNYVWEVDLTNGNHLAYVDCDYV